MWPTQAFVELGGGNMSRITALFVGVAALTVISTVAEAEDGCGRGWYYNGRRCVPMDAPMYRRDYGPPVDRGPGLRLDLGGRRDEARYGPPNPAFKTWNNCPPNFTVQDGLCKPYRGRRSIRSSRGRLSCRPLPVALVLNDFLVPVKRWLLVWRVPVLSGLNPLWTDLNSAVAGFGAVHVWSRGRLPRGPTGRMR